jgi:broad specificity phosphatase PhoE
MLNLYFVRHGQTEWNTENRFQGRKDSNLTDKGIDQAKRLSKRLKDIEWTAIYSSPSKRTMETVKIVKGNCHLSVHQDERLMEMHLGVWEGMTQDEIKELNGMQHDYFWNNPSLYQNDTGESFDNVKDRIEAFIHEILQKYESGNILILTHGVVIKMVQIIGRQLGMDQLWKTTYIEGTSLTKMVIENKKIELEIEGDITHLD